MMQRTDRHFRYFMRQITRHTLLYTEMVTTGAILHGDRGRLLGFSELERPLALQLGGDDPKQLAQCARIAEDLGYDEINLNVGCPSSRVRKGSFGACLMRTPHKVADAVAEMRANVHVPVTVKHRIGVDELDRYEDMAHFVEVVAKAGCRRFSVHARKAWLNGLSPKDNRTVPPLRYEDVYRLKQERPDLYVEINGGIMDMDEASAHLNQVDAVMIGRAAYDHPFRFITADARFFGALPLTRSRHDVVESMYPYIEAALGSGVRLHTIVRHMLTLFGGQPGTRAWKRFLTENACKPGAGLEVLRGALARVARSDSEANAA
jgi:tRNA-dihydrouridine synthase A